MKRNLLVVGIILLFTGTCIIPASAQDTEKQSSSMGNWLYVGGGGPGNYSRIQDAIDNTSDGDTVFVFNGFYQEGGIVVKERKYITIIGEDKNTTIVDGGQKSWVFQIANIDSNGVSHIKISRFTIQNASVGVYIYNSDYNIINDNIIQNNVLGRLPQGIVIGFSNNNSIYGNVIRNNEYGIYIWKYPKNNKIEQNLIENNSYGIKLVGITENTFISKNTIINNFEYGVCIYYCYYTIVEKNNIYKNHRDAFFVKPLSHFDFFKYRTFWNENFWGNIQLQHKIIVGTLEITLPFSVLWEDDTINLNWLNFDWHPAQGPYDIPEMR
jgi:parallel beta-helix repeat protein